MLDFLELSLFVRLYDINISLHSLESIDWLILVIIATPIIGGTAAITPQ